LARRYPLSVNSSFHLECIYEDKTQLVDNEVVVYFKCLLKINKANFIRFVFPLPSVRHVQGRNNSLVWKIVYLNASWVCNRTSTIIFFFENSHRLWLALLVYPCSITSSSFSVGPRRLVSENKCKSFFFSIQWICLTIMLEKTMHKSLLMNLFCRTYIVNEGFSLSSFI